MTAIMRFLYATSLLLCLTFGDASGHGHDTAEAPDANVTDLAPQHFAELGAKRITVKYGSHVVNSRREDDGMSHFESPLPPPCTECLITFMQAQLEYPNGTVADADYGMWMHHVVFFNQARNDSVCISAPQRFFASGNERSPVDLTVGLRPRVGYPLHSNDQLFAAGELMNMLEKPQVVVFSMTWEYIPTILPNFEQAIPIWLDVTGCGGSEVPAKAKSQFMYASPSVNSSFEGSIVMIGGHLHDGGTYLDVLRNGMVICTTTATYSDLAGAADGTAHINTIKSCVNAGRVAPGDRWTIEAHYDTVQHPPMAANDGSLEPVMGIALAYVTENSAPVGGLYGPALIIVILLAIMTVSLAGLYVARRGPEKVRSAWNAVRNRGWQRVDATDAELEDSDAEDGLLLQRHGAGR